MLGNAKFSLDSTTEGVSNDLLTFKDRTILIAFTFLFIIIFIVVMLLYGKDLLGLNARYTEPFLGNISCANKLDDEKMFCSTEYKKSLFTNLVALDKKIDYLKKKFEKNKT